MRDRARRRGRCFVVDLDSACGVVVHGEKVTRAGLHAGDRVRVGSTEFVVERRRIEPP